MIAFLLVLGVAAVLVWAVAFIRFRLSFLWVIGAFLNVLQFGWTGLPIGPQAVWAVATGPAITLKCWDAFRSPACIALATSVGVQLVAVSYSVELDRAAAEIIAATIFTLSVVTCVTLIRAGKDPLRLAAIACAPMVVAHSLATVLFQVDSDLKIAYLQSDFARVLVGRGVENLFSTAPNNVLYDFKSGGLFFVNANMSSLFLGISSLSFAVLWWKSRQRVWLVLTVLSYASVFFTGSKTGLTLGVFAPLFLILLVRLSDRRGKALDVAVLSVLAIPAIIAFIQLLNAYAQSQVSGTSNQENDPSEMADVRLIIWRPALTLFKEHPFVGLGFGGWQQRFTDYVHLGSEGNAFPPHNFIIAAWASAGALNTIALLFFLFYTGRLAIRFVGNRALAVTDRVPVAVSFTVLGWTVTHGLGDNTYVYGTAACIPLMAAHVSSILAKDARFGQDANLTQSSGIPKRRSEEVG